MKRFLITCLGFAAITGIAYAADTTVTQSHTTFDVDSLSLNSGDTIIFKNADDVTHNIQIVNSDGDVDDKGLQKPGQEIKSTLTQKGEYKARCAIHPKMKMAITVK
ncbi:MAG: cupredoxin domain-containing protein [Alphaproteobacteria bacterium]|nr:cupredoxin domain-containing protein [Alphaproteobacteria bacterium]MBV8548194.1 cupredoxin domain-containing protein [Alphaproteobacteria bacterium]